MSDFNSCSNSHTLKYSSYMLTNEFLKENSSIGFFRNLETNKRLILPTNTHLRLLVSAVDVLGRLDIIYYLFWIVFVFYFSLFYRITPRFKRQCSWETSNSFFVSIQKEALFFLKDKLSESELNLSPKLRLIDDPQNLHAFFEKLKSLRGRPNLTWIDELFKIFVAETAVDLRKFAGMQHRNSSKSKVSFLRLIKSDYFLNLGVNSCEACLLKVQDDSQRNTNTYLMCF